jgi:5'(3')-deoxyribonucleotidase
MDDTICDFTKAHKRLKTPDIKYTQSQMDFFRKLEPINGAIPSVKRLGEKFDVWFLTRPSYMNPLCYTEKRLWIEDHFGVKWCERLILCPDKSLMIGDYLIDDYPWPEFEGKQVLFGSKEYPDWNKIVFKFNWEIETI